jgi:hypothetical protein
MTTTRIEFQRVTGTDPKSGDAITETIDAEVVADGESVSIELPAGGPWECDLGDLRRVIA